MEQACKEASRAKRVESSMHASRDERAVRRRSVLETRVKMMKRRACERAICREASGVEFVYKLKMKVEEEAVPFSSIPI